jgi:hypothetical protein
LKKIMLGIRLLCNLTKLESIERAKATRMKGTDEVDQQAAKRLKTARVLGD